MGGELRGTDSNAGWGSGEWIVVEADESDRSLLKLEPEIAVLTNAELDHHSTYASRLDLEQTLRTFMARAGRSAVVWNRPELLALCPPGAVSYDAPEPMLGSGGVQLHLARARGLARAARARTTRSTPPVRSRASALAGAARGSSGGRDRATSRARGGVSSCWGAPRRRARLRRLRPPPDRGRGDDRRGADARRRGALVAVFQPHLYSRTRALAAEFGRALAGADVSVVLDVYPARERAEDYPGVDGRLIAQAAADAGAGRQVAWLPRFDEARQLLAREHAGGRPVPGDGRRGRRRAGAFAGAHRHSPRRRGRPPHQYSTLEAVSELPAGVQRNYPLARLTTIRTGGPAELFARAGTLERARAPAAAGLRRAVWR